MTYRNSCLAVLVGDVGKSSSLEMKIGEKARKTKTKQIKNKHSCKISQLIICNPQYDTFKVNKLKVWGLLAFVVKDLIIIFPLFYHSYIEVQ